MTYMTGEMEKFRMTLNVFSFQSGIKSNDKASVSIKMLLLLKTMIASCGNIPATQVSSWL